MYYLEGDIGVGKSTVLAEIHRQHPEIAVYFEPVLQYQKFCGSQPLKEFYQSVDGAVFRFQLLALAANYENFERTMHLTTRSIIERSIHSSFNVFTRTLYDTGSLSSLEFQILEKYYNILNTKFERVIIYLKASPALCKERIRKRGRDEEVEVSFDYLVRLDESYEKFIHECRKTVGTVVVEVDASRGIPEVAQRVYEILSA